ncbi:general transcription factor II-I repeat domain-containing protein 2 [Trichonephila clavipes]|nr:general transcription factor II-I repeat domain-containing protein 2 [Trichonephila clavipes]
MVAELALPARKPDLPPFSECLIKEAEVLCPPQIKTFKSACLSRNIVENRINEIAENVGDEHHSTISTFPAYSIAIDEITDTRNIARLAIFIHECDVNLKINEEFLEVTPLHITATRADIFDGSSEKVQVTFG